MTDRSRQPARTDAKFSIAIAPPPLATVRSGRVQAIIEAFLPHTLARATKRRVPASKQSASTSWTKLPLPERGELFLFTGPSGSGKSVCLRRIVRRLRREHVRVISLRRIALVERPIIELFADESLADTLRRLSRVGLAEVWTWLRPPSQLSEGQRWRLRLALALAEVEADARADARPTVVVCDEFAAVLDRISACVIASVLRRAVDAHADRLAAVVATSHDDLVRALEPEGIALCDFGSVRFTRRLPARSPADEHGLHEQRQHERGADDDREADQ